MSDVAVASSNEEISGRDRVDVGSISDGELPPDEAGKVDEREKEKRGEDELKEDRHRSRRYADRNRDRDRHRGRDDREYRRRDRDGEDRGHRDRGHRHRSERRHADDNHRSRRRSRGRSDEERDDRGRNKKSEAENLNPNGGENATKKDDDGQQEAKKARRKDVAQDDVTTRTGGAYIPPAKLRMMQEQINDKTSVAFQRLAWEALKKSINGLINKVSINNVGIISRELFKENLIRGRGLLTRSLMQAQAASPTFSNVYASLLSVINSKFPPVGALLIKRLIIQFRRGFRRNDKNICLSATRFLAHLVNQQVAHEIVALEILTLFLENPTDDSVEVAIGFLKECGAKLAEVTPRGMNAIFDRLRSILQESQLDKRVQYMIEVMFAIRKDGFKDHPAMQDALSIVEEKDQYTHSISLDSATDPEDLLNVFKPDPNFEITEEKYQTIKNAILEDASSDDESGEDEEGGGSGSESEEEDEEEKTITDNTETDLTTLRRTIYLTIQSSLDFEECAHKLLKMELKPGQEVELCHMILDCCAQQRTYEKFYGLLGSRFCQINKVYVDPFEQIFCDSYDTIHRLETNKLRNVAKFFAHLLFTDAISWMVLGHIKLNEDDTTSSNRIFIKILFQELSEYMGLPKLNARIKDPTLDEGFAGLFPRDNPRNTRFAINFFTSIGLGGLTDELREHIKVQPKRMDAEVDSDNSNSSSSSD